jgi:hypothetical protein
VRLTSGYDLGSVWFDPPTQLDLIIPARAGGRISQWCRSAVE